MRWRPGSCIVVLPGGHQHGQEGERCQEPRGCSEVDGGDDHESVEQGDEDEPQVVDVAGRSGVVIVVGEAGGVPGAVHHVDGKPDQRTERDLGGAGQVRPVCRHGSDHEYGHGHEQPYQRGQRPPMTAGTAWVDGGDADGEGTKSRRRVQHDHQQPHAAVNPDEG